MKKIIFSTLLSLCSITNMAFSCCPTCKQEEEKTYFKVEEEVRILELKELNNEIIKNFFENKLPNTIIEVSKDLKIPANLFLNGDLLSFSTENQSPIIISVNKSFYIRSLNNHIKFSTDLNHWYRVNRFIEGNVFAQMKIINEMPVAQLGANINERVIEYNPPAAK